MVREFYSKIGYDSFKMETSPFYISELAIRATAEIDNYLDGKNTGFFNVHEFEDLLRKVQSDSTLRSKFPYKALWRALGKVPGKDIQYDSQLDIEIRLLRFELKNTPSDRGRAEKLKALLCNISIELLKEKIAISTI